MVRIRRGRRSALAGLVVAAATLLTGCEFNGVNSLPLPGGVGTGDGSYTVDIELPNVGNLRENAQVKMGDVAMGTVTALSTRDWHAVATVSLAEDVRLPDNAVASVGQNSLLGASYIEMAPPPGEAPTGRLAGGDTIPLARGRAYPSTEEVLAATSVVLNGSGLNQLETITRELQRALGGEGGAVGELLPKLDTFVSGLDAQRGDIVKALDGLNRLSAQLAGQNQVIADAVDQLGPALQVLDREREDLTRTLRSLGRLGDTTTQVIDASRDDLLANLNNLQPVLKSVADADKSVVESLKLFGTFPFPAFTAPNACRGDFCNLRVTVDLTLDSLDADLLTGTPLQGSLLAVQNILGGRAPGAAGDAGDPLRGPLGLPTPDLVAPAPADTAPPAAPAAPRAGDATPAPAPAPDRPDQGQGGLLGGIFGGER